MGLKGMTVTLTVRTISDYDDFGAPVYTETTKDVQDVIVAPAANDDIVTGTDLYGKKAVYTLGIPKGNADDWENTKVSFFGHTFRTFGPVVEGIEENVPLRWHRKVMVERYE